MNEIEENPLFVDLDGTYTKTDLLLESFISAFRKKPYVIFYCLIWLIKGKAFLKYKLAKQGEIEIESLPLNPEFIKFLKNEKSKGRKLYLATAASKEHAQAVCNYSNLFVDFISSDENTNLKGEDKLNKIKSISEHFSYAGNANVDFKIFKHATQSILVNPSFFAKIKSKKHEIDVIFDVSQKKSTHWIKQLRLYQWSKNLLIYIPLIVSGQFINIEYLSTATIAFFAFSLLASSTYIINDLLDISSDRKHPRKKDRPIAAGNISISSAVIVSFAVALLSFSLSYSVGLNFFIILVSYLATTLSYSFVIKRYIGMDVVTLAFLYTIRIVAGAVAIGVLVSFWLLAFSIFIFLSLALVKRCAEIKAMEASGRERTNGRDYSVSDLAILESFGSSSGVLAVLMFCFYINNNVLTNQYQQPDLLWLIVPALCYWIMRMWIKTHRGEMHDDPIVFSLKDKGSMITITFCALITITAQIL